MFELKRSQIVPLLYILSIGVCSARLENQSFAELAARPDQLSGQAGKQVSDQIKDHVKGQLNGPVDIQPSNQFDDQSDQSDQSDRFGEVDRPESQLGDQADKSNGKQPEQRSTDDPQFVDELAELPSDSLNDYVFSEKVMLNKLILENNNLPTGHGLVTDHTPPDSFYNDLQSYQQAVQQNRSKVFLFRPKQVLDSSASSQDEQVRESHLSLPTKSTLSKSFPQLYKQLYKLEKSPLQRDLQQFFRATVDPPSTSSAFAAADRPFDAKAIEANAQVSAQTIQNLPLPKADPHNERSVQTDPVRFPTAGSFDQGAPRDYRNLIDEADGSGYQKQFTTKERHRNFYGDPNDGDKYYGISEEDKRRMKGKANENASINTESSNKNESLVKSDGQTRNENQTSIQIENLRKRAKKLTYEDFFRYISPLEFKVMKAGKGKFNTKRYVPKIIYSNARAKSKKKRNRNVDQTGDQHSDSNDQNSNSNNHQNENNPNGQTNNPNGIKLIPVSYLLDDSILNGDLLGLNPLNGYQTAADSLYPDSLSLLYNLNSFDLIGTLISGLIGNLPNLPAGVPNNLLDFSLDLPRNLPDLINEALLVGEKDESNRRLEKRARKKSEKKDKRRVDELKREQFAQVRQLLGKMQAKELVELLLLNADRSTNGESGDAQPTKSQLIELLKKNAKVHSLLSGLSKLYPNSDFDLSKLDLGKLEFDKLDNLKKFNRLSKDAQTNARKEKRARKEEGSDQPKCIELNNSTICFTNIDGVDGR